jgi:hypothetical protein
MVIDIEKYISDEEIKEIIIDVVKSHIKNVIGDFSVSIEKERVLVTKFAKNLAKEGVQEIIPNFKELINEQIESEIKKIKLSDFFLNLLAGKVEVIKY